MDAEVKLGEQIFRVQLSAGQSIARTTAVTFGEGPFDVSTIQSEAVAYRDGKFIGDVLAGGSCNVSVLKINPHCCGTHTETLMHVMPAEEATAMPTIDSVAPVGIQLAFVLTIKTCSTTDASAGGEVFTEHAEADDRLVSAAAISTALADTAQSLPRDFAAWNSAKTKALVLRVAAEDPATATSPWAFGSGVPPYFTSDAIELLNDQNVEHLLVEFPSIDRLDDGGRLTNHHKFWNVAQDSKSLTEAWPSKTITEMIELAPSIKDGLHLLSIQVPPVRCDAMLSRPVLFELFE